MINKTIFFKGIKYQISTTFKNNSNIVVNGIELETITNSTRYHKIAYLPDSNREFLIVCYFFKIYIIKSDKKLDLKQNSKRVFSVGINNLESYLQLVLLSFPLSVLLYISQKILTNTLYYILPAIIILWIAFLGIFFVQVYIARNPITRMSHRRIIMYIGTLLNLAITLLGGLLVYSNIN